MKRYLLFFVLFWASVPLSGCSSVDTLKLLYGNKFAPHQWQSEQAATSVAVTLLNKHVLIPVAINNTKPLRLVLDSGAAATVLFESERTRHLKALPGNSILINGNTPAYVLKNVDVTVGDVTIAGLSILYIRQQDNPFFHHDDVVYFDGAIGYDILSRFATHINLDEMAVTFSETKFNRPDHYAAVPLKINGNLPYVDLMVPGNNGDVKVQALLDTGGTGSLALATNQHILPEQIHYQSFSVQLGGRTQEDAISLNKIRIGPVHVPNVVATIATAGQKSGGQNILGNGIISKFNVIIDYPNQQLFLAKNSRSRQPDTPNFFGLTLLPHRQGAYIYDARPSSPAASIDLRKGDIITSFNGQPVHEANYDAQSSALRDANAAIHLCWLRQGETLCKKHN